MDPYLPFGLPVTYYHGPERREHFAPQFGFRMPMMAPQLQFSGARSTIPPQYTPVQAAENASGKKKNRWSDTKEKILIELFGENEDKLRYKSYTSPEWASITPQLRERC